MTTAIVGRMACGHVVAVDLDDTPKHRAALQKRGYTVEAHPVDDALALLKSEGFEHIIEKCNGLAKVAS